MKKNILPFGIIAIVGVLAAIIVFYVGVDQRKDMQQAEENGGEAENEESVDAGEEVFQNNCATCHGDDLSGDSGPDLTKVGSEMSEDDIHDIIENGQGSMPPGVVAGEEANLVAEWLSEYDEDASDDNDDESSDNNDDNADNNEEASADDSEEIFANNCATCHGDDLSGDTGPDLTKIGNDLSEEDILDVIDEGPGAMPPGIVEGEEADSLAKWLSEMK